MFIIPCQTQDVCESGLGIERQEKQSSFHLNLKDLTQQSLNAAPADVRHELLLVSEVRQQRGKCL